MTAGGFRFGAGEGPGRTGIRGQAEPVAAAACEVWASAANDTTCRCHEIFGRHHSYCFQDRVNIMKLRTTAGKRSEGAGEIGVRHLALRSRGFSWPEPPAAGRYMLQPLLS